MFKHASWNCAYSLVWNEKQQTYVPAPEKSRSRGKRSGGRAIAAMVSLLASTGAYALGPGALPTGGNIVAGTGSISQSGAVLTVTQGSAKLAADWQSFNIGQGHTVNFVQPSSSAVALNRVLGSDVSVIQGALNANGQVFLVNPNGVLFTPTAQVNVGSIVASTLNISTADFMAGNYKFDSGSRSTGEGQAVINQGNINATGVNGRGGSIALIAARIINTGTLSALGGNMLVGAGSKVTLDLGGPIKLRVEQGALEALISNGGAIRVDGGLVYMSAKAAGDLTASVINHSGVVDASSL
ncbi:MAG: filamentous hemagglutinin N-terminal domain-containing protein, partial [Herbaspirillum sp.]